MGLTRSVRSDRGTRRIGQEVVNRILSAVETHPAIPVSEVLRQVSQFCVESGIKPPSYQSVRRVVQQARAATARSATSRETLARGTVPGALARWPDQCWRISAASLLQESAAPGAGLWITAVVDEYSRAIPGYTFSTRRPTIDEACLALRRAVLEWVVGTEGEAGGLPAQLCIDWPVEIQASLIREVCASLQIVLIEGHGLAGSDPATLMEPFARSVRSVVDRDFAVSVTRVIESGELDRIVGDTIRPAYHARVHPELGESPSARRSRRYGKSRLPLHVNDLDLLLPSHGEAKVDDTGGVVVEVSTSGLRC